jgi:hypothetical protein
VVDLFGIKYLKQEDFDHIVRSLEKHYNVAVDLDGKECMKIDLDWDYENKRVHLSMAPYLQKAVRQFDNLSQPTVMIHHIRTSNPNTVQSNNMPNMTQVLLSEKMNKSTVSRSRENLFGMHAESTAHF